MSKYRVQNCYTKYYCGPNGARKKYYAHHSNDPKLGFIFETADINIAFIYKIVMEKENRNTYEIIEVVK